MLSKTRTLLAALPLALVVAALSGSPSHAATVAPTHATPQQVTQGIIMSDGRICDPIRWGC